MPDFDITPTIVKPRISCDPRHVLVPGQWLTLTNVVSRETLANISAEDMWFRLAPHVDMDFGPMLNAEFRNLTETVEIRLSKADGRTVAQEKRS